MVGSRVTELLSEKYNFIDLSLDTGVNILDQSQVENAFLNNPQASAVIHMAAFTDTNAAWNDRGNKDGLCYKLNVSGTENIVNMCRKYNKFLVYISTDFVFDGTKTEPYAEDDQPNPIEWYGQTKHEGEKLVLSSGIHSAVVRIAFPYRAGFPQKFDIVRKIIAKLENGDEVKMFTDQITTPTYVDDIAFGLDKIIENNLSGIYHLVGSSSQSPFDMAKSIARILGLRQDLIQPSSLDELRRNQAPDSRPWQTSLRLSNQKITDLGIRMSTLEEGLEKMKDSFNS